MKKATLLTNDQMRTFSKLLNLYREVIRKRYQLGQVVPDTYFLNFRDGDLGSLSRWSIGFFDESATSIPTAMFRCNELYNEIYGSGERTFRLLVLPSTSLAEDDRTILIRWINDGPPSLIFGNDSWPERLACANDLYERLLKIHLFSVSLPHL